MVARGHIVPPRHTPSRSSPHPTASYGPYSTAPSAKVCPSSMRPAAKTHHSAIRTLLSGLESGISTLHAELEPDGTSKPGYPINWSFGDLLALCSTTVRDKPPAWVYATPPPWCAVKTLNSGRPVSNRAELSSFAPNVTPRKTVCSCESTHRSSRSTVGASRLLLRGSRGCLEGCRPSIRR